MMPLTVRVEVEDRLGRSLTPDEETRFDAAVRDVSAYLFGVAPRIPSEPPIPDAVLGVASNMVIGVLATPAGSGAVSQESLGGYSVSYRGSQDGLTLNDAALATLAPWRRARIGSVQIDPTTAVAW